MEVFLPDAAVLDVGRGDQKLRDSVIIFGKELVIQIHELALTNGSGRLLGRRVLRSLTQIELREAHRDGAGGDEDDLMPGVFQIGEDLAQLLDALDVQPPGRMRQSRCADFYYDFHGDSPIH